MTSPSEAFSRMTARRDGQLILSGKYARPAGSSWQEPIDLTIVADSRIDSIGDTPTFKRRKPNGLDEYGLRPSSQEFDVSQGMTRVAQPSFVFPMEEAGVTDPSEADHFEASPRYGYQEANDQPKTKGTDQQRHALRIASESYLNDIPEIVESPLDPSPAVSTTIDIFNLEAGVTHRSFEDELANIMQRPDTLATAHPPPKAPKRKPSVKRRRSSTTSNAQMSSLRHQAMPFCFFKEKCQWKNLERKQWNDDVIDKDAHFELACGSFMEVQGILTTHEGDTYITGALFEKFEHLGNMVDCKERHVCLIQDRVDGYHTDVPRDHQYITSECQLLRKVSIIRTNLTESWDTGHVTSSESETTYVCHLKRVGEYSAETEWHADKFGDTALISLTAQECNNSGFFKPDTMIREQFRGHTPLFGSGRGKTTEERERKRYERGLRQKANRELRGEENPKANWTFESRSKGFDLSSLSGCLSEFLDPQDRLIVEKKQSKEWICRYTLGDAFCGAGGLSRGAIEAGMCLKWAFDKEEEMCLSYRENFPWVDVLTVAAYDFLHKTGPDRKVDIMHLSPVCKPFSPAHTTPGKDDEQNQAASFAISGLLQLVKPRIITLEQTGGLENSIHINFRNAVIRQIVSCGYSIRWKVFNLADFGVAQPRKRFLMIGSCPGEALPPFPETTHGDQRLNNPNLKPWTYVNDAITGTIPQEWPFHDVESASKAKPSARRVAFDGAMTQAKVITTKGGVGNCHPSGSRGYTISEEAMLQGFPIWHEFPSRCKPTKAREQLGNAVPPIYGKRLYDHIRDWLVEKDMEALQEKKYPSTRVTGENVLAAN